MFLKVSNIIGCNPVKSARKYAAKHVHINAYGMPKDAYFKLVEAKDMIGNYAKAHNITVRINDAGSYIPESHSATEEQLAQNKVAIQITPRRHVYNFDVVEYTEKEDKPFIKSVYESLQRLVEGKDLRIQSEIERTRKNLSEYGKF